MGCIRLDGYSMGKVVMIINNSCANKVSAETEGNINGKGAGPS